MVDWFYENLRFSLQISLNLEGWTAGWVWEKLCFFFLQNYLREVRLRVDLSRVRGFFFFKMTRTHDLGCPPGQSDGWEWLATWPRWPASFWCMKSYWRDDHWHFLQLYIIQISCNVTCFACSGVAISLSLWNHV